jgi:hypothetical protein
MASFTAGVDLLVCWKHTPTGTVVEIASDKRSGIPLAAGEVFTVPDAVADDFESDFGDQISEARYVPINANVNTLLPAQTFARIPGLTRL